MPQRSLPLEKVTNPRGNRDEARGAGGALTFAAVGTGFGCGR
jgi:hypothetical protein